MKPRSDPDFLASFRVKILLPLLSWVRVSKNELKAFPQPVIPGSQVDPWKRRCISPVSPCLSSGDRHHHPHHGGHQHASLPRSASGLPGGAVSPVPASAHADRIWSPAPLVSTIPSQDVRSRTTTHLPGSQ